MVNKSNVSCNKCNENCKCDLNKRKKDRIIEIKKYGD